MNGQNIPPRAKKVFVPSKPGYVFIEPDYMNLELRIIAYISDDDVLQRDFAAGKDAHDENTKNLFHIDKSHEEWKARRKICN